MNKGRKKNMERKRIKNAEREREGGEGKKQVERKKERKKEN